MFTETNCGSLRSRGDFLLAVFENHDLLMFAYIPEQQNPRLRGFSEKKRDLFILQNFPRNHSFCSRWGY